MDLDRASLDLMIRLLELEQDSSSKLLNEKDMNKIKEKIRKLCETVHNKHLDLENITVGYAIFVCLTFLQCDIHVKTVVSVFCFVHGTC